MTNLEKYNKVFMELMDIGEDRLKDLKYQDANWDSVGHMNLMVDLEEIFKIEMDADDIIEFSSYIKGTEILAKYNIQI